jgi:hypothetical protein
MHFLDKAPAPVSNINVTTAQYSAIVSWKISTSTQNASYITQINIYLNNKKHKILYKGTQVTINGLIPHTLYNVGIQAQHGTSQRSQIVYTTFKTKEAGIYILI